MNPTSDCSKISTLEYRKLCQALSRPPSGTMESSLTGHKDTDLIILSELDDKDLINYCTADVYANNLCNTSDFWKNKTVEKYGNILGSGKNIKKLYKGNSSWKEYYLWLSGILSGDKVMAAVIGLNNNRKDILNILKTIDIKDCILALKPVSIILPNNINLGPSDPSNPYSEPLINVLNHQVSDLLSLLYMSSIYKHINNVKTVNLFDVSKESSIPKEKLSQQTEFRIILERKLLERIIEFYKIDNPLKKLGIGIQQNNNN